jgi:hypothetical protein
MLRNIRNILFALLAFMLVISCRKSEYKTNEGFEVIEDNGGGTGTVTWTKGNKYLLSGLVFVNEGQVLTIEPGTVIRAKTGQAEFASALIVARGGKIIAEGTMDEPIIFTCEGDDLEGSVPVFAKGLWGGLIVLGYGELNNDLKEAHIEGISLSEPRGVYGGLNNDDNSGKLKYISIRHGGTNIGDGNEINGLTFGGVGQNTEVDYIEVVSNYDDGIEFFGGKVNCKHLLSAFNGDDAFDYDLGYSGKGQFWCGIQDPANGDLLVECGGGVSPELGLPLSHPVVFNGTFIGIGTPASNKLMNFNHNACGTFANSVYVNQNAGVSIQFRQNSSDCYYQFEQGNLQLLNNVFYDVSGNDAWSIFYVYTEDGVDISQQNENFKNYFELASNIVADPGLTYEDGIYQLLPSDNVFDDLAGNPDIWYQEVYFKGAFGSVNWAKDWTLLFQEGFIQ